MFVAIAVIVLAVALCAVVLIATRVKSVHTGGAGTVNTQPTDSNNQEEV